MCEANAKEMYQVAVNLELAATTLRMQFEEWKHREFEK